jgi:hypothetical protein
VTRNSDRKRICGAGLSHRPDCPRRPDAGRDAGIGGGVSGTNFTESLPDPQLERGALEIQRKPCVTPIRLYQSDCPLEEVIVRDLDFAQCGLRKPTLQVDPERVGVVAEQGGAETPSASGDQQVPQRTAGYAVAYLIYHRVALPNRWMYVASSLWRTGMMRRPFLALKPGWGDCNLLKEGDVKT